MRPCYLKNAALLTGADVVLRLAGMGLRIWLANALGGEGMGLYQLVLAVYSLFVTLATSGVSVAATRLMAEELSRSRAEARGMLLRLLGAALLLGSAAWAGQFGLAELAAAWWLGDVRAAGALRAAAFGLPWMAVSAVLRGFFIARRQIGPNVVSQLVEQAVRISAIWFALERGGALDVGGKCTAVLAATALSETVSACLMLLFYRREAVSAFGAGPARRPMDPAKRLWEILWPVEGGRCLASAPHTAENMLVPACLTVYLLDAGGRSAAVAQYGNLKGMALPLLTFPFGLLGSLSVLLMPEITQAHIRGETGRLSALLDRMLRLTGYFSGDAADVSGKHGGRCHEGGRGAEGRVPVQPVGCRAAHRGGDGAAAPVRDERLPVRHPAVQCIYLPGQHGPPAAGQRDASGADALAGGTVAGGGRVGRGGGISPGNAVRLAGRGDAGAAGGAVHRLLQHGAGGAGRRLAAGSGCRGAGRAPPGPGPAEGEKSVKSTRTMKSSGHRGTKRV